MQCMEVGPQEHQSTQKKAIWDKIREMLLIENITYSEEFLRLCISLNNGQTTTTSQPSVGDVVLECRLARASLQLSLFTEAQLLNYYLQQREVREQFWSNFCHRPSLAGLYVTQDGQFYDKSDRERQRQSLHRKHSPKRVTSAVLLSEARLIPVLLVDVATNTSDAEVIVQRWRAAVAESRATTEGQLELAEHFTAIAANTVTTSHLADVLQLVNDGHATESLRLLEGLQNMFLAPPQSSVFWIEINRIKTKAEHQSPQNPVFSEVAVFCATLTAHRPERIEVLDWFTLNDNGRKGLLPFDVVEVVLEYLPVRCVCSRALDQMRTPRLSLAEVPDSWEELV